VSTPRRSVGFRSSAGVIALAACAVVALPSSAGAASHGTTKTSASTITLGAAFRASLRGQGISLTVAKPATLKGARLRLPVTKTATASSSVTLTHGGSVTFRAGRRSAKLTSWRTVATKKTVRVSAVVAKRRRTIFTIAGGTVTPDTRTGAVSVRGGRVNLTPAAAKQLRTALAAPGLRAGRVGSVATAAKPVAPAPKVPAPTPTPAPAPTPRPTPLPLDNDIAPVPHVATPCPSPLPAREAVAGQIGDAAWTLRSSWYGYLKGLGGCVVGTDGAGSTAPASEAAPRFAVTGTTENADGTTTVTTRGTVWFLQPAHDIDTRIANPTFTFNADGSGHVVADGQGSGSRADAMAGASSAEAFEGKRILDFASSTKTAAGAATTWSGIDVTVADGASRYLAYPTGDPFGTFSLSTGTPIQRSSLAWTQTKVYDTTSPTGTNRTWLGYAANNLPNAGPPSRGTMSPSDGASGDTVVPTSPTGPTATYLTRFPAQDSTLDPTARVGTVRFLGTLTYQSVEPGHEFRITIKDPRVVFDGDATAKLFATGEGAGSTATYDDSSSLFDLNLAQSTTTDNGDGTVTLQGVAPSLTTANRTFPGNYGAGAGPERTPNTFGVFSITVPTVAPSR
jgi:hypothetical protein